MLLRCEPNPARTGEMLRQSCPNLGGEPLPVLRAESQHRASRVFAVADSNSVHGRGGYFDAVPAVAPAVTGCAPGEAV